MRGRNTLPDRKKGNVTIPFQPVDKLQLLHFAQEEKANFSLAFPVARWGTKGGESPLNFAFQRGGVPVGAGQKLPRHNLLELVAVQLFLFEQHAGQPMELVNMIL